MTSTNNICEATGGKYHISITGQVNARRRWRNYYRELARHTRNDRLMLHYVVQVISQQMYLTTIDTENTFTDWSETR